MNPTPTGESPGAPEVFVLSGLAVAGPALTLLAAHPVYFLQARATPGDLVLLAATLSLGPPLIVIALARLAELGHRRAGRWVRLAAVAAFLGAWILLGMADRAPGWPLAFGISLLGGGAGASLLARGGWSRTLVRGMAPVAVALPLWFLTLSPVAPRPRRPDVRIPRIAAPAREVPVVVLLLDELPLTTLLDHEGGIDPDRFPHLAALAGASTWFRRATSVHTETSKAVESLLTGRYPQRDARRITDPLPQSLFTFMASLGPVHGFESATSLCPPAVCGPPYDAAPRSERWASLLSDTAVVYLHSVLPVDVRGRLPVIETRWGGLAGRLAEALRRRRGRRTSSNLEVAGRVRRFERFLASFEVGARQGFWFHHSFLPHRPWRRMPSGTTHAAEELHLTNASRTTEGGHRARYLLHQLQAGFVDRLVGRMVARLRETGLFERALVVVTADQGESFAVEEAHRELTPSSRAELLYVPFLVKAPGQVTGAVSDRPVETLDVPALVAEVLGARLPWSHDGLAVLDPGAPPRTHRRASDGNGRDLELPLDIPGLAEATAERLRWRNAGSRRTGFLGGGPHPELRGRRVGDVSVAGAPLSLEVRWDGGGRRPGWPLVAGRLEGVEASSPPLALALAVRGVVRGTTWTFRDQERGPPTRFVTVLPEEVVGGGDPVEVRWIETDADAATIRLSPPLAELAGPEG